MIKYTDLITQEERETMDRIDEDCKKLHIIPPPKAFLNIEVIGKDGNIKEKLTTLSKSWVRNAYNQLTQQMLGLRADAYGTGVYGAGGLEFKNTAGTTDSSIRNFVTFSAAGFSGVLNDSDYGVVVGTGSTAESFEDHVLATQCTHGTGVNQFTHLAGSVTGTWNGTTKKWTSVISRNFQNNSAAAIIVAETGIYLKIASLVFYLLTRDLLSPTVSVGIGETIKVDYTIESTYPS